MVAGKEERSRQYDGMAMSSDEASKVPQIKTFVNYIYKSFINNYLYLEYIFLKNIKPALCDAGFFDSLKTRHRRVFSIIMRSITSLSAG